MEKEQWMAEDFKKCVDFHGHLCGGLVMGYKASKAALEWFRENRAQDEELVAIVENDACGVDAVQVLTGCTFGKGNFIYKDYGKIAFTFFCRKTGKGIRISPKFRPGTGMEDVQKQLFEKQRKDTATKEELSQLEGLKRQKAFELLEKPTDELFLITLVRTPIPEKAEIHPSIQCSCCGEPAMATKMETMNGKPVCRGCLDRRH
ncbi:MAG: formylmethanofuran dehydrogenase [Proteobacteria bacterium]|nr:formylmethanofuran dehydrogenase [Pseudomonadota bacterium]